MNTSMMPLPYRVVDRRGETADTVTLTLEARSGRLDEWSPGQFTMVYAFGIGEVPVSVSGGADGLIQHTVRSVGSVTHAICAARVGTQLGLRGPYGHGWPPLGGHDVDVLVVAGGIGLAPLRPVVTAALGRARRVVVLIGARTPADLIFTDEYHKWRNAGAQVLVTVDRADAGWMGHVGVVTTLLDLASYTPRTALAYVCGPEVMMRHTARALVGRGLRARDVHVSLERNMRCGIALCGHCQLGPLLVCRDGPVAGFDVAEPLFETRDL
jgi:anaerobic sulfite reductase subunit B